MDNIRAFLETPWPWAAGFICLLVMVFHITNQITFLTAMVRKIRDMEIEKRYPE